ncbi:putative RNA-directed DNA polymerase from transposon X-element [Trichonephila clavipes]|nr:putative RNA-directed DNA polymerase from transposon X-element [Trichonephila clavipes]
MLNFDCKRLHNSDHSLLVSHVNGAGTRFRPPTYHFHRADWDKFKSDYQLQWSRTGLRLMQQSSMSLKTIRNADAAIPRTSNSPSKAVQTMVERFLPTSQKEQKGGRRYVSSITSSTTSQQLWRKVKAANGLYRDFEIPILETSTALYSSPLDVANLIGKSFASVSSSDSYSPAFQATKPSGGSPSLGEYGFHAPEVP